MGGSESTAGPQPGLVMGPEPGLVMGPEPGLVVGKDTNLITELWDRIAD